MGNLGCWFGFIFVMLWALLRVGWSPPGGSVGTLVGGLVAFGYGVSAHATPGAVGGLIIGSSIVGGLLGALAQMLFQKSRGAPIAWTKMELPEPPRAAVGAGLVGGLVGGVWAWRILPESIFGGVWDWRILLESIFGGPIDVSQLVGLLVLLFGTACSAFAGALWGGALYSLGAWMIKGRHAPSQTRTGTEAFTPAPVPATAKKTGTKDWVEEQTWQVRLFMRYPGIIAGGIVGFFVGAQSGHELGMYLGAAVGAGLGHLIVLTFRRRREESYPVLPTQTVALDSGTPVQTGSVRELMQSASQAFSQEEYARALPLLEEAAGLVPEDFQVHIQLGVCLGRMGRMSDAHRHLSKAVELNPNSAHAHYNLGVQLQLAGRLEEAKHHFEAAVRLDPGHRKAVSHLREVQLLQSQGGERV